MKNAVTNRQKDERHLEWLQLRDAGVKFNDIAKRYGVSKGKVVGQVNRIERDYLASEAG